MKKHSIEQIEERYKNAKRYLLVKVTVDDFEGYCVYAEDTQKAFECLGQDNARAKFVFDIIAKNEVSAIHLADVIADMREEIFV